MKTINLIPLRCLVIFLTAIASAGYGQDDDNNTEEPPPFHHFAVKIYSGYSFTHESSKLQVVKGKYDIGNSLTAGVSVAYHYDQNWSAQVSISTGKYKVDAVGGDYTRMDFYRHDIDLGYIWIAPVSFSVAYHLNAVSEDIVPYAGAGGSYVFFTNVDPGWAASSVKYQNRPAFFLALGADYDINSHWFVNAEIRQFFTDRANVEVDFEYHKWQLNTQLSPNPINITAGIGYRF